MEVHHHGHVQHQKKWKSYLFQFFMLFLAVFLGFLAEYQLEHVIEKKREKEYIKLLVEDLQTDTAILHAQVPLMKKNIQGLDTLINQVYFFLEGKADTRLMYYAYHHYCRNKFILKLSQRTLNQLKNSGNLRLIHDKSAAYLLDKIETGFDELKEQTDFYNLRQEDAATFGLRIFDFKEYIKANVAPDGSRNPEDSGFLSINYQPALNVTDPVYLKEFAARLGYYRNYFGVYVGHLETAIPTVEKSIDLLRRNYHINSDEKRVIR
jgi:hypothetical protein